MTIDEGEAAHIKAIKIIGNQAFSERELLKQIQLTTPGWLTWFTKTDQYSRQKLGADLETLRSYYLDRGFLEFTIDSTQVSISPDRKEIFITLAITEGKKFTVSNISFSGETFGREAELKALMQLKSGDVFNGTRLSESMKAIGEQRCVIAEKVAPFEAGA